MLEDLDHLAGRVRELVQLAQTAQAEKHAIAERLAHSEAEIRRLRGMLATARERVDGVLARLPDPDATAKNDEAGEMSHGTA